MSDPLPDQPDETVDAELFGPLEPFLAGYRAIDGALDEMVDERGALRPHWRPFVEALAQLGRPEMARRFLAAARHLHDAGVYYRVYDRGEGAERPWPLNQIPVLIAPEEWRELAAGLVQRAQLMEAVVSDCYGPQELIKSGVLPASVIAGSPEFLRPLVGVKPAGGRFLRFYAADVGRGPDGRWWVIDDRTQAPSGAGYALENRIALSRTLPEIYRSMDAERLAGFFQAYREGLSALGAADTAGVCLLTPGPLNETYFEHAYLARYLGFLLVEGEDLAVQDDSVFLRTVAGLLRADVLVRRLDSDFADPLELNAGSHIGTPGLTRAVRAGSVAIANALGAGVLEAPALMGFLPRIAESLLGEPLKLPNIATWWCGQEAERETVISRLDEMLITSAYGRDLPAGLPKDAVVGADLKPVQRAELIAALRRRGEDFVGQEIVRLSTTPVWTEGRFAPRPFSLRLFVAATEEGWTVMPGAFCRISDEIDARAVSMQAGGRSADVWVLSDAPVEQTTLLPGAQKRETERHVGALTSRAADNLFWLGRYMERAEATLRLLRAYLGRSVERDRSVRGVLERLTGLLGAWGAIPLDPPRLHPAAVALATISRDDMLGSARTLTHSARRAASAIRERLSADAWGAVTDLYNLLEEPLPRGVIEGDAFERANRALRIIAAFSGFAQENMTRGSGWLFLDIGRRLERALATCRYLQAFIAKDMSGAALDTLLELGDSQITYAQRYFLTSARAPAIDLLLLDVNNPRSVAFQVDRLDEHVGRLPGRAAGDPLSASQRLAARLAVDLHTADVSEIRSANLAGFESSLLNLAEALSDRYLINRGRMARRARWDGVTDE